MTRLALAALLLASPAMAESSVGTHETWRVYNNNGACGWNADRVYICPTMPTNVESKPPAPRCDDSFFPVKIDGSWKCVREVREPSK